MSRTKHLREHLHWSQARMADYLGLAQSAVSRLENGQRERGYVARLLDQLEREFGPQTPATAPGGSMDAPADKTGSPLNQTAGASLHQEAAE